MTFLDANRSPSVPHPLNLACLPLLKSLTLAADITNILDSAIRFDWVINILESIPSTSRLGDITMLIRTPSLQQGEQCDWTLFDSLFDPSRDTEKKDENVLKPPKPHPIKLARPIPKLEYAKPRTHWPHMKLLKVVWCTARSQDLQENQNSRFVEKIPTLMPHIHQRGIVKMHTTYSDSHYNFWTFT